MVALKNSDGFSILEVLLCSMVIAICVSVSVPRLAIVENMKLDKEIVVLLNKLRYTKELNRNITLSEDFLSTNRDTVKFIRENTDYYLVKRAKAFDHYEIPSDVEVRSRAQNISFDRFGRCTKACTIRLTYKNRTRYVIVDTVGRIRVSKTDPN